MNYKVQEAEQQGQIKSTLEETLDAVDSRVKFFQSHHLSLEPELIKLATDPIKSIADIASGLGTYFFSESPVQPNLRDLYTTQYQTAEHYRCVLPPPSEGEESVTQQQVSEPSFKWLSQSIIDSTLITTDKSEPKKPQKGNVPLQWGSSTQLLLYNISKKIHVKSEIHDFEQNLIKKFFLTKVKNIREIYFKGKPSLIIRFINEYNCSFAYYNFCHYDNKRKQIAGDHSQIFKITSNRLKSVQQQKWVAVLFRRLPPNLTKEILLDLLRKRNISPVWMQQLIQIDNFKYTLCRVSFLDDVFELCSKFQINTPLKEVKVNLHPKSCKAWKGENQDF